MKTLTAAFLLFLGLILSAVSVDAELKQKYYAKTCPQAEAIIAGMMQNFISQDVNLSASIVRLHFHDCFVEGCDGSVLLNSTEADLAEKDADPNMTLQGFDIIDQLKGALETKCPGVVSCADILAYAARESVFHAGISNYYSVRGGRRDGTISLATEAVANLPPSDGNVSTLTRIFASKGLSSTEMVVLSGAHSIGVFHCSSMHDRQFSNYDPNSPLYVDPDYEKYLQQLCPKNITESPEIFMDSYTPTVLDNKYYVGLLNHRGVFPSDATLLTQSDTKKNVVSFAKFPDLWAEKFVLAMIKMGEIQVKTRNQGQVRKICSAVNS